MDGAHVPLDVFPFAHRMRSAHHSGPKEATHAHFSAGGPNFLCSSVHLPKSAPLRPCPFRTITPQLCIHIRSCQHIQTKTSPPSAFIGNASDWSDWVLAHAQPYHNLIYSFACTAAAGGRPPLSKRVYAPDVHFILHPVPETFTWDLGLHWSALGKRGDDAPLAG